MKFAVSRAAARWLFINTFVVGLMFSCVFNATSIVEESMPEVIEPVVGVEDIYANADHPHNSPQTLKNDRNSGFVEHHELQVEWDRVERKTYFDVPLSYDLQDHIFEVCEEYDVDPAILFAMIWTESSFRLDAVGDNGDSIGLLQVQPKWHQKRADTLGCSDLHNPYNNITVGISIIAEKMHAGRGMEWALMSYNGGASYANRKVAEGVITPYVTKVLNRAQLLNDSKIEVERIIK